MTMRKLFLAAILAAFAAVAFAQSSVQIALSQTATGSSARIIPKTTFKTFQAAGTTTAGAGAATIKIQGSNVVSPTGDGDWVDLGTITLTLSTTRSGDGFASDAAWLAVRSNVTAISGTGAAVTVTMGY